MALSPRSFACDVCGASLSLSTDDAVLSATCAHCQHVQPMPDAERRKRALVERQEREEAARERSRNAEVHASAVRSSGRMTMWITLGTFLFAIGISAVTAGPGLMQAWSAVSAVTSAPVPTTIPIAPVATPIPVAVAPIAPVASAAELAAAAQTRVAGRMRERMQAGCRRVVMPPEVVNGPRSMTANLVKGRQCIEILAIAGSASNALTLTMTSPFGEPIAAPAPGPQIEFRYCPEVAGPHPVRVSPAVQEPYALAAIECRARR